VTEPEVATVVVTILMLGSYLVGVVRAGDAERRHVRHVLDLAIGIWPSNVLTIVSGRLRGDTSDGEMAQMLVERRDKERAAGGSP
jgi:hypothetical protein